MVRPNRSKTAERVGKGKVTPVQVAYLVDRYLCDNRFLETRSLFRSEASSLISKSPVREVPNSLIPLDDILNEYISLKEQKVVLDQEKVRLDQEKTRVQNLLNGMQNVMNVYNSTAAAPPPAISSAAPAAMQVVASTSQPSNLGVSPSDGTANLMPASLPGNKRVGNFTEPCCSQSMSKKRKSPEVSVGAPCVSKKGRLFYFQVCMKTIPRPGKAVNYLTFQTSSPELQTPVDNSAANESSSVAKCLFSRPEMSTPTNNSAALRTPQKQVSPRSDVSSVTPQEEVSAAVVTKERITVSPHKQMASYTVERSHMVSSFSPVKSNLKVSSKRGHVKGRLNFDDTEATMHFDEPATRDLVSTSSSGSEGEAGLFDLDFSNIDILSENFPFSELLVDFDLGCEATPDPCLPQQPSNSLIETPSGSSPESMNRNLVPDQVVSEYTSTMTQVIQGKDMNTQGSDSMTTVKSITKCLRILSPAKSCNQRSHN
ncbi:unnamed protein product [Thlaspi arvense]|uniref:Uncharacterized protein n=1 Tax=Thlaspi arvense TaxID=13288 RepID=A0AAU9S9C1_THLAR|nr:unnamed protein product [Thlaspi arvense]